MCFRASARFLKQKGDYQRVGNFTGNARHEDI